MTFNDVTRCVVIGAEQHDDRVRAVGERTPASGEDRATVTTASWSRTHGDGDVCLFGGDLALPSPAGGLHEHSVTALIGWPGRHTTDSADRHVLDSTLMAQDHSATMLEHATHRCILEEHVGLKILDAGARCMRDQPFYEVRPEPPPPVRVNGHGQIAVAISTKRIPRFTDHLLSDTRIGRGAGRRGAENRDDAVPTAFPDGGPRSTPVALWRPGSEKSLAKVTWVEREVERVQPICVLESSGSNHQRSATVEIEQFDVVVRRAERLGLT